MNADLLLFRQITNRLVYLTTRDEYGSSRSLGIGTVDQLYEDLNDEGIVPSRGFWTGNSLRLFFHRIWKRYDSSILCAECDFDFVGRHSWEYQSYTKHEDICDRRNSRPKNVARMTPIKIEYERDGIQSWKEHEIPEVSEHDKKMQKILKRMK